MLCILFAFYSPSSSSTTTSVPTLITSFFWSPESSMMCSHRTLFARCLRWLTQRYAITRSFIALFVAMPAGLLFNFQETTQEKQENKKKSEKSDRLEKTYPGIIKCNFSLLKNHWPTNHRNASNAAGVEQCWGWLATTAESVTCKVKWDN